MSQKAPTILIVDDSATTRTMIKRIIGMTDLTVGQIIEAADGAAGLAAMENANVQLVLADLNMPIMDGFEMIRQMRLSEKLRTIPIIVISAQPDTLEIDRLKRDGVAAYLPKPFTPEAMRDLIKPLFNSMISESPDDPTQSAESLNLPLVEALGEALETMAFITPQLPGDAADPPLDVRLVLVEFHGHGMNGSLALAAPRKFGALVAGNCDGEEAITQADDALKELANVTCGLLLRKRGGGAGFEMSPPHHRAPRTNVQMLRRR